MSVLQVLYSCEACHVDKAKLTVAHRKENEDIKAYVEELSRRCYHDHWAKFPLCKSRVGAAKIDLMIPLQGDAGIGMVPEKTA
jgi:hypothetical protein